MAGEEIIGGLSFNVGTAVMVFVGFVALIFSFIVLGGGTFFAFTKFNQMKLYSYQVHIYSKMGHRSTPLFRKDVGGVFTDKKTGNLRFFLKNQKVGMNPDNIPYMINDKGKKIVTVVQHGLKNFRYADMAFAEADNFAITVGEEDVNWALNELQRLEKRFILPNFLAQYGGFVSLIFVSLIIMVIFIFFFRELGVLSEVASKFESTARILQEARLNEQILPT